MTFNLARSAYYHTAQADPVKPTLTHFSSSGEAFCLKVKDEGEAVEGDDTLAYPQAS